MIAHLLEKLIGRKNPEGMPMPPESEHDDKFGLHVVTPGDTAHEHVFNNIPWDYGRFGPHFNDFEENYRNPAFLPIGTYKFLFSCICGAEAIQRIKALI